jgi:hypothetical protein
MNGALKRKKMMRLQTCSPTTVLWRLVLRNEDFGSEESNDVHQPPVHKAPNEKERRLFPGGLMLFYAYWIFLFLCFGILCSRLIFA